MSLRLGRFNRTRSGAARCAARKRQQSDVASALDRDAEPALVTRADTRHAARKNFAAFLHELGKNVSAFVVDEIHLLDTKLANFLLAKKLALAAARSAGAASWPARAAFAASAATATGTTFTAATAATWAVSTAMRAVSVSAARAAFTTR